MESIKGQRYITIREDTEIELNERIKDLTEVRKTHELVAKRKWYEEHTGNKWYAKLRRVNR